MADTTLSLAPAVRSVNGGDDQILSQPGLDELDNRVVVERLLGLEQGAENQERDEECNFAHAALP